MEETSQNSESQIQKSEREFIYLLIELYRDHPELWKVNSKNYFNRHKKNAACDRIVQALKALKPEYTVSDLKKKINVLRTNFNREHKNIENKKKSGAFTDDIPEPSLWYYHDLAFIKDQIETAETETTEEPFPDEDSKTQVFIANTAESMNPRPAVSPQKKKRKGQPDATEQLAGLATEYFKRPLTEEDIVAQSWAMKLKKLRPDQKRFAEKIINDTLFEAEMCTLTREGLRFETYQRQSPFPASSSTTSPN